MMPRIQQMVVADACSSPDITIEEAAVLAAAAIADASPATLGPRFALRYIGRVRRAPQEHLVALMGEGAARDAVTALVDRGLVAPVDGGRAYVLAAEQRVVAAVRARRELGRSVATPDDVTALVGEAAGPVSSPNQGPGLRHAVLIRTLLQRTAPHPGEAIAEAVNAVVQEAEAAGRIEWERGAWILGTARGATLARRMHATARGRDYISKRALVQAVRPPYDPNGALTREGLEYALRARMLEWAPGDDLRLRIPQLASAGKSASNAGKGAANKGQVGKKGGMPARRPRS
jgi:hypothetical protein